MQIINFRRKKNIERFSKNNKSKKTFKTVDIQGSYTLVKSNILDISYFYKRRKAKLGI